MRPRFHLVCFLLILLFPGRSFSQDSLGFYWNRCVGGSGNEVMQMQCTSDILSISRIDFDFGGVAYNRPDIAITPDNGSLLVTSTASKNGEVKGLRHYSDTATGGYDVFVVKYDSTGRIEWKKCFGGSDLDYGSAVYVDVDGYLIGGSTKSPDGDFNVTAGYTVPFLVKVDFNGNVLWKKIYQVNTSTDYWGCVSESIKKVPGGGYVYLINRWDALNNARRYTTNLYTLDASGNYLDKTTFAGNKTILAAGMIVEPDGSVLVAGSTTCTTGPIISGISPNMSGYLTMLRRTGNTYTIGWIQYPWSHNNASHSRILDITQSPDGKVYLAGTNFAYDGGPGKATLYRYDTAGTWKYTKDYSSYFHQVSFAVDAAGNNGVVLSVFSNACYSSDRYSVSVLRADSAGVVQWQKCFYGDKNGYGFRIKYLTENEQYIAAITNCTVLPTHTYNVSYYNGSYTVCPTDLWMMKMGPGNMVTGNVFNDLNKNGILNTGEPLLPYVWVKTGKNNLYNKGVYSYDGKFLISVDTGLYNTKVILPPGVPFNVVPGSDSYTFTSKGNTRSINFAVQSTANIYDAAIDLVPIGRARSGRDVSYKILCSNVGSLALGSNTISLVKDSRLTYYSASPAPTQIIGDTLKWSYSSMAILADRGIYITFHSAIPPVLFVGDTLRLCAKVVHVNTDATPANNDKCVEHIVVGSNDPNDKTEVHNGKLLQSSYAGGEYLDYVINFQNVGTDTAFYVEIRDTLEAKLDAASIKFLGASHGVSLTILENKYLVWKFNNIVLTALSQHVDSSKGYVAFRIRPVTGLSVGQTISNSASIYFDYNLPVKTNTVTTEIYTQPLPVTLLNFTAAKKATYNVLQWTTTREENAAVFFIERSSNGTAYESIGSVAAKGNTTGENNYAFNDLHPLKQNNFYRLRMADKDGKTNYSPVRLITAGGAADILIYPNPVKDKLFISSNTVLNKAVLKIISASGKLVFSASGYTGSLIEVATGQLSPGIYYVQVEHNGVTTVEKMVKQ